MANQLCPVIWSGVTTAVTQPQGSTTQRLVGTSVTWTCQTGYTLQDATKATTTCQTGLTWSNAVIPTCIAGTDTANADLSEVIAAGTVAAIILLGLLVVCCCAIYWWANEEYVEIIHYTPTETTVPRKKMWLGSPPDDRSDIHSVNSRLARAALPAPNSGGYIEEVILEPYSRRGSYSDSVPRGEEVIEVVEEVGRDGRYERAASGGVERTGTSWFNPRTWGRAFSKFPRLTRDR